MKCPQCDIEMEVVGSGSYAGLAWYDYECPFCDYCYSDEPDWDSMSKDIVVIK